MTIFNADWDKRVPIEFATDVYYTGHRIGQKPIGATCFWSGYVKDEKYYISLCDNPVDFWEVSLEDVKHYILNSTNTQTKILQL